MNIQNVYERVTQSAPVDSVRFMALYNDICGQLCSKYGSKYVNEGNVDFTPLLSPSDTSPVFPDYFQAIVFAVLYELTGSDLYAQRYDEYSDAAYRNVWKRSTGNRKIPYRKW